MNYSSENNNLIDLKKMCYQYAKENFRGKAFFNMDRQAFIQVSKRGLDEWYSKSKSREQILSIRKLDSILENAVYTHSAENKHKTDRSNSFFDYFECLVEIGGIQYVAVISIRNVCECHERKLIYYHHYFGRF